MPDPPRTKRCRNIEHASTCSRRRSAPAYRPGHGVLARRGRVRRVERTRSRSRTPKGKGVLPDHPLSSAPRAAGAAQADVVFLMGAFNWILHFACAAL